MKNSAKDFYNQNPVNEWNRLFLTPYRRIEFDVIHHFLAQYLPPSRPRSGSWRVGRALYDFLGQTGLPDDLGGSFGSQYPLGGKED